ncbi:hybrid non-ribosomal peptide synthetase/type I polyketide synthase [Streptomyces europaeiscabiei]|uniref:hybrid non-ribosomal peptide synthetase/type I polyketide synthase n=1 Tax=Streptomyces europaeiscabiei TaxID=146819 RepID=UPI0007660ED8|nr:hybrid non-ribosomal peptide synthetase/type I polyketide synthase [Streptomyces europaeiscabiei]
MPLDGFYDRFRDRGIDYGPAFQGLVDLWRQDYELHAVLRLPESLRTDGFGIHPALLDAAFHTILAAEEACEDRAGDEGGGQRAKRVLLPFEWSDARLYATGASVVRVRVRLDEKHEQAELCVTEENGSPVATASLRLRKATAESLRATQQPHLYRLEFQEYQAPAAAPTDTAITAGPLAAALELPTLDTETGPAPSRIVVDATQPCGTPEEFTAAALVRARDLLADPRPAGTELVWVTRRAVSVDEDETVDLASAPLWGLLRAARAEGHPVRLVDVDEAADPDAVRAALTVAEPELVVRGADIRAPRLVRLTPHATAPAQGAADATEHTPGTVLITGGTGELGRQVARHLVGARGVRKLVLASRRGDAADGSAELIGELTAAGADSVRVVACDVTSRDQVAALVESVPDLSGVWHLAGVLDDGLLTDQTPERLERVWAPKARAAWWLHELTADRPLTSFVVFSSAAGVLGSAGQSAYAAANAFADAVVLERHRRGLPALSLSWGLWEQDGTGLTAHLGRAELARMRRQGVTALTGPQALGALDAALTSRRAHLVPLRIDLSGAEDDRSPLLRGRTRMRRLADTRTDGADTGWSALPEQRRLPALTDLVRREAAEALGSSGEIHPDTQFTELGLDSLMAVELRRRLSAETGLSLPATAVFDHPTPAGLARYLDGCLGDREDDTGRARVQRVQRVQRRGVHPATEGQRRLWFLEQMRPGTAEYNVTMPVRVAEPLDRAAFASAVEFVVRRHEALRTGLESRDGELVQVVHEEFGTPLRFEEAADPEELAARIRDEAETPFDLSGPVLLRCLVLTGADDQVVCFTLHHAIIDASSLVMVLHELFVAYDTFRAGLVPDSGGEPPVHLGDYAGWERDAIAQGAFEAGLGFFRSELAGAPRLELPRGTPDSGAGKVGFALPDALRSELEALASDAGVTLYTVLAGSFAVLLSRYSDQRDFSIGTVWSGRTLSGTPEIVGFLANTLPLRCDLSADPTVPELLAAMKSRVLGVMEHQNVPLSEVVRAVGAERNGEENPLFRAVFNYGLGAEPDDGTWQPFAGSFTGNVAGTAKFELTMSLAPAAEGLSGELEFQSHVLDQESAQRMVANFETLLHSFLRDGALPVSRLPLLHTREEGWFRQHGDSLTPDTAALPPAQPEPTAQPDSAEPAAGADLVWQTVLSAWSQVLEVEPDEVDPDSGFFDLGGTSLTAVRVHELVRAGLDREFPLSTLFRHSTVRRLTTFLSGDTTPAASAAPALAGERADEEAVAIVGVALRLPGASDAEEFWANLRGGVESIRRFTDQEMLDAGVPAHVVEDPAFVHAKGYVGDADLFDAEFFGYSPSEAENMDPQHRLFLETAWQGLENAGIVHDTHPGRIGVFGGVGFGGYDLGDPEGSSEAFRAAIGNMNDFLTTRLAHKLNLRGPALTVQTACSTGLVLAHLARQSLLRGESDVAIVGASALTFPLEYGYPHQEGFVFSPDGSCRAFDADRQGTVVGNGVVAVVMRRLSDAVVAGDRIYAVVRGSAINNDGSDKVGFTAPSVSGQAAVITDALADAGLSSADIGYVEAHGTATAMGDLIEIQALQEVFSPDRDEPCAVGSVKSNIGHVDVAAGLAGLVKAALCVYHGELVPTVNFNQADPELGLDPAVLRISDDTRTWPGTRRAGVSSFGIGGTNAHLVIEQPPQPAAQPDPAPGAAPAAAPVVLSGRTPQALRDQARQWAHWLTEHPDTTLTDLAWTTTRHRRHFSYRAAVLAHDLDEAVRGLTALGDGQTDDAVCTGVAEEHGKVAFVFAGHGAQWPGMAQRLLTESPAFADTVARCDEALRPWTGWSVQELLENPDTSGLSLDDVEVTQPALFTVALGLAQVWRSVGLEPEAVVGHSQGEVPAAVVAGALTLEEGARIVAVRSQAFGRIESGSGGMALLGLPLTEVEELLADYDGALSVAAVNTPGSVAVAGAADAVDDLLAKLADRDVFSRRIKADRAGHCSLVDPMLPEVEAALNGLRPRPTTVPMYSTVTGAPIGGDTLDARYWCRNLREPVRMDLALDALRADGYGVFTEVSPHPLLAVPLTTFTAAGGGVVLGSLRRDHGGLAQILRGLGELHVHGHPVDWTRVIAGPGRLVDVPGYAFQRQSYWIDGGARPRQERQAPPPADLATRLAALPEPARARTVLEAVQDVVRGVLGLGEPLPVDERFQGRGLDSMMALQLRNRLSEVTGAPLPSTLAFEHPTPQAVVDYLLANVFCELPSSGPSMDRAERREVHPATEGQRRLWFLERMRPDSAQYNAVLRFEVDSPLCPETFRSALRVVMERHEALRTGLESRDGELVQVVHREFTVPLRHERVTGADELDRMLHAEERVPFELDAETLFRCLLVDSGRTWTMCFTMHHAITDGWSMSVLLQELHETYRALAEQGTPQLAEVRYHLGDYARWEKQSLEQGAFEPSLAYFASELDGCRRLELPERAAAEDEQGDAVHFTVPAELRAALDELATRHCVTGYTVYVSAFAVLLARYTDQYDFSLGTIWSARELPQVGETFGFLANTLPLRCDLTGTVSFEDVIAATHTRVRGVFEHQSVPLSEVVRIAGGDRTGEENPLFRAVFNYSGTAFPTVGTGEAAWRLPPTGSVSGNVRGASKFELGLTLSTDGDELRGELEFQAHVLDQDSARRMAANFETLLASLAAEPARPVREAGLLCGAERDWLAEHGGHVAARPAGETACELILAQVARTPDAVAVASDGGELTYREMSARARAIARELTALGVRHGDLVGLCLPRTADLPVAMLATWMAGAAYVPLDPAYPKAWLDHVVSDSGLGVVISSGSLPDVSPDGLRVLSVEEITEAEQPGGAAPVAPDPSDPAFVIYTSGTTGTPKGVVVEHTQFANFCGAMDERVGGGDGGTWLAVTSMSFDTSGLELLWTLTRGYRVVIADGELADWAGYRRYGPTHLQCTPSLARTLLEGAGGRELLSQLRLLMVAGEALDRGLSDRLLRTCGGDVFNMYGPTETTIYSTGWRVEPGPVCLGTPVRDTRLAVLDRHRQPVPRGCRGELWIGGRGVARGYWNRAALTDERFVVDPFPGAGRMYRSGDVVRYREDGSLEYCGRTDSQVKLAGHRIELGEVESVVAGCNGVREAAAVVREDTGRPALWVFYSGEADQQVLAERAAQRLPVAMLPTRWVRLESLPQTPNRKIDRLALAALPTAQPDSAEPAAGADLVWQTVLSAWSQVLEVEPDEVDPDSGFFDLGGTSLTAVRVHELVRAGLDREFPLSTLFRHSTVRRLTTFLSGDTTPAASAAPALAGERADEEAVAIVGVALRLPGASDAEEFWANLRGGVESIRRFTDQEMLDAGVPAHVVEDPAFVHAKGYVGDADLFDAEFFGYSPSEAENMDPQHRLFLETAWQGLENAGIVHDTHPGRIGVFGGVGFGGYDLGDPEGSSEAFRAAIGNMNDFLTTRLAHKLNLRGPALTVQTACSTGLVLAHLARQSLLRGESDVAIVGASALTFPLEYGYPHQEGFVFSPDGSCRAFDADRQGTVVGNGVVAVVMRRLSDAVVAGDRIYAVVRGSAINNDGSDKVGFTAPSVSGQAAVITDALADAGLSSADIGYVEAHGTATAMGDLIEIQALQEVFSPDRDEPCAVGSVKSNIGHVDVAAGLAGLVKAALCVYHGELVPTVNFNQADPELGLDPAVLRISDDTRTWPGTRRAGVSSFGIGGTNAHLVIEQPPQPAAQPDPAPGAAPAAAPVVLSGRTPQALRDQARQWAHWLTEHPDTTLTDLAWTTTRHRRHFAERASVAGPDLPTVIEGLTALAQDQPDASVTLATARPGKVVFVFPGQGSQWPGMAQRLLTESPAFADTVARCDEALRPWTGWSVHELLQNEDRIAWDRLDIAQPVLFTMYLALAAAMRDLGLEAQAVVGHSQGEIPAAVVAGSLTLEEGARIVAERSKTLAALSSDGEMATVQLPVFEVEAALAPHGNAVSVAVVNTPGSTVISGDRAVVEKLLHAWDDQDVMCGKLNAACASHSSHMDALLPGLRDQLAPLNPRPSRIPLYSTVLGRRAAGEELDADYWCRNLREPVRLDLAQQELLADGYTVFVEVSPHPVLAMPLADGGAEQDAVVLAAMERDQGGLDRLQHTLGALHAHGVEIDWPAAVPHGRMVDLPGYAFQRQRHWKAPARRKTTDQRFWDAVGADETDSLAELLGASGEHRDSVADLLPLLRRWHESRDGHAASADRPHEDETTGTPQDSGLAERLAGMDRDTQLTTVLELVRTEAAAVLGTTRIPAEQPLQQLGMDSLMAVGLRARLARRSGLRLGTDVLFRQGGCAGIAQHVVDELTGRQPVTEAAPDPLIRVLKPARHPKVRILCMSGMGGTTTGHVPLIPHLPEDVELLGVRVPGREGRSGEAPVSDVNVLVDRVVADLSDRLDVPIVLYGHSQGAYTAWEIAHRLGSRVGGPDLSLVAACAPSPFSETPEALKQFQKVSTLWDTATPATLVEMFRGMLPDDILDNEEVFGTYVENLRADFGMWNRHQLALQGDRRGPLDIPITAVSGTADPVLPEGTMAGWSTLTSGEFVVRSIEGSHSAPLESPKAMAEELTAAALSCGLLPKA